MNRNIVHRLSLLYLAMTLSGPAVADTDAPKPAPCSSAENAEFDFWVGDWKVSLPDHMLPVTRCAHGLHSQNL